MNYYELLNIDPKSSQEEIKRSYLKLIKLYHPDLNPDKKDATKQTQLVNEAYGVLSDIKKRSEYDFQLYSNRQKARETSKTQYKSQYGDNTQQNIPIYSCEKCGKADHTLRICEFLYVISLVIVTSKDGWAKILCNKCRVKYSLYFNLVTAIFGWWGIPYGPFYAIEVLFKNTFVKYPIKNNIALLEILIYNFYNQGNYTKAYQCLIEKLKYESTNEDLTFLNYLSLFIKKEKSNFADKFWNLPVYIFNIPILFALFVGLVLFINSTTIQTSKTVSSNNQRMEFTGFDDKPVKNVNSTTSDVVKKPTFEDPKLKTLSEKKLPSNGIYKSYTNKRKIAPLEIYTNSDLSYYVKIVDYNDGNVIQAIFIRPGMSVKVKVPLGSYDIKYATGSVWYGDEDLFGPYTMYYKADALFTFEVTSNRVNGYRIELFSQLNGNLETEPLDKSQF